MIQILSDLFNGIKKKSNSISGVEICYSYTGKPIFFDPLSMLKELSYKVSDSQVIQIESDKSLSAMRDESIIYTENLTSGVTAKFKLQGSAIEVIRSVKNVNKTPVSRYEFKVNSKTAAIFQRKYDRGLEFDAFLEKIENQLGKASPKRGNSFFWKNQINEALFLEKFGQTQIWLIYDFALLTTLWNHTGTEPK